MLTFPYDTGETPPFPGIDLIVHAAVNLSVAEPQRAKLDSGAGVSVVPQKLISRLHLFPYGFMPVQGYDGVQVIRSTYLVTLIIGQRRFDRLEVIALPRTNVLLGRDVLNELEVCLDGPRRVVEIRNA
jgi:hypothetical protein